MKAKLHTPLLAVVLFLGHMSIGGVANPLASPNSIERLTHSGNSSALYPCLSDDGMTVLYVLEINDNGTTTKSIRLLNTQSGEDRELYRSGEKNAPPPFENRALLVGTKPPQISGNGRTAVFSLSLDGPAGIPDHYLGVIESDGTNFQIFSLPIHALEGKDLKSLDIASPNWERLANYAVDSEGNRIVCVVKGHLGPSRHGNPSGIMAIDLNTKEQRTLLAPTFEEIAWTWPSLPKNPLTGGGWSFGFSGNGETVIFGAQTSDDRNDYDLYTLDWKGSPPVKLTDFHDRWFSLADIDFEGEKTVFYYTGQKKQGIGTYFVDRETGETVYLISSNSGKKTEFYAMSDDGRYLVHKQIYSGIIRDLSTGIERTAFDEHTPGYAHSSTPMDFPRLPSFWCPQIMSAKGDRILLMGYPEGKSTPEIFMLHLDQQE